MNGFEYDFRFHFLPIQIRKELSKRLTSVSDTFGLEDLYYDSFTRRYGMNEFERWVKDIRTELSAADVVYATNALLEKCEGDEVGLMNDHVWIEGWDNG